MSDDPNKGKNHGWTSEPIRGLDYSYLDIDEPISPPDVKPELPKKVNEFNKAQAEDFYTRTRDKIARWAEDKGAGKAVTKYVLLVPDIMALLIRLMGDPDVSTQLKAEIAAATAYIILPIDLLPEAALGPAGLIDDAIIGVLAMNHVLKEMGGAGAKKLQDYWDGDDDVLQTMDDLLNKADQFLTGTVWTGIKKFMGEAVDTVKDVADSTIKTIQQGIDNAGDKKPAKGPVVEGSYRSILPPGVTVDPPEMPSAGSTPPDVDKSTLPPNERG